MGQKQTFFLSIHLAIFEKVGMRQGGETNLETKTISLFITNDNQITNQSISPAVMDWISLV